MKVEKYQVMYWLLSSILFSFLLGVVGVDAKSCKDMRLDGVGHSMEKIPVMDQDGKPLCYAYAAGPMVDAWRFSHGDKDVDHLTSPVAAGVYYANQFVSQRLAEEKAMEGATGSDIYYSEDFSYGWVEDTLTSIAKKGSCDHNTIYSRLGQANTQEYFDGLNKYFTDFDLLAQQQRLSDVERAYFAQNLQCKMYDATAGLPVPVVSDLVKALSQPSYLKFLEKVIDPVCRQKMKAIMDLPKAKVLEAREIPFEERAEVLADKIAAQFAGENPQPMGINFCGDLFYDSKLRGVDPAGNLDTQVCNVHHVALVIGTRAATDGGCEFLVRNSQGESCYNFPEWESKCEKGQYWMRGEDLMPNILKATWLPQGGAPLRQER